MVQPTRAPVVIQSRPPHFLLINRATHCRPIAAMGRRWARLTILTQRRKSSRAPAHPTSISNSTHFMLAAHRLPPAHHTRAPLEHHLTPQCNMIHTNRATSLGMLCRLQLIRRVPLRPNIKNRRHHLRHLRRLRPHQLDQEITCNSCNPSSVAIHGAVTRMKMVVRDPRRVQGMMKSSRRFTRVGHLEGSPLGWLYLGSTKGGRHHAKITTRVHVTSKLR